MILKKILNSLRFDQSISLTTVFIVIGIIGLMVEGQIYFQQAKQINQLKAQIQKALR